MAKLPDSACLLKSDENHNNLTLRLFSKRQFSVAVLATLLNCTISIQAAENDSDGDGLTDTYEIKIGSESYLTDTDGDGISDNIEVGADLNKPLDSDNDGVIDVLDHDDDNDGLPTYLESKEDSDNDGLLGYLDMDSDNDSIVDGEEAGVLNQDKNQDGIDDAFDLSRNGSVDKNGDGIDDNVKLPDHDNDGNPDYLDTNYQHKVNYKIMVKKGSKKKQVLVAAKSPKIDKKAKESQLKLKDKIVKKVTKAKPDNMVINRHTDSDNDGLSNALEKILGTNPLSRDSDSDKVSDAIEIGMDVNSPQDSDRDGIIDALDNDDDNDGIPTALEDLNGDSTAINDDTDNDGVPNYLDGNDDGDNKLTIEESYVLDSDADGILDYLDKNDGIKNQSDTTNTKTVVNNTENVSEPEIVVLFDGDEAALLTEENLETDEIIQDKLLSSLEEIDFNSEIENPSRDESSKSIKQATLKIEKSTPVKNSSYGWDLF